jgi:hypothetical protein
MIISSPEKLLSAATSGQNNNHVILITLGDIRQISIKGSAIVSILPQWPHNNQVHQYVTLYTNYVIILNISTFED